MILALADPQFLIRCCGLAFFMSDKILRFAMKKDF